MNSLDAIIAIIFLTIGFGLLMGAINSQKIVASDAFNSLEAKSLSLNCAAIIDSVYSNTVYEYGEMNCFSDGTNVMGKKENKKKYTSTITSTSKSFYFEVKTLEHYTK